MCDPVIDEHFRRSLGANYMSLFPKSKDSSANGVANGKNQKVVTKDRGSSPIMFPSDPCTKYLAPNSDAAKSTSESKSVSGSDSEDYKMDVDESSGLTVDDHFAKALGDTWKKIKESNNIENKGKNQTFSPIEDKKDLPNSNHDKNHTKSLVI